MAQIFPKWVNRLHLYVALVVMVAVCSIIGLVWYYGSPLYTDVGYQPAQPVAYSHKLHAGDLGVDCRYCHNYVEVAPQANIPPTQTCMNCHSIIKPQSEKMIPVMESWTNGTPIEWVRVHELPDYVYFDHSLHLRAGVGCFSCHGSIVSMEEIKQVKPLSMSWCLDCHRDPTQHIRPVEEIVNMEWEPPSDQEQLARKIMEEKNINPPIECSACHR